jgi:hypothetical protein
MAGREIELDIRKGWREERELEKMINRLKEERLKLEGGEESM